MKKGNINLKIISAIVVLCILIICTTAFCRIIKHNTEKYAYISKGPGMNYDRIIDATIKLNNGNWFIIGWNKAPNENDTSRKAEIFDSKIQKFIALPDTNYPHNNSVRLLNINHKIYLFDNGPIEYYDEITKNFVKTNKYISDAIISSNVKQKTCIFVFKYSDNKILVRSHCNPKKQNLYFWNLKTEKKTNLPKFNMERLNYFIIVDKPKIIVAGGQNTTRKQKLNNAEIYIPKYNKFSLISDYETITNKDDYRPEGEQIFTDSKTEYFFNDKENKLTRVDIKLPDKYFTKVVLNQKYDLYFYNKTNLFSDITKTDLYLKDSDKFVQGPDLLYKIAGETKVIKLNDKQYLLFGNNMINKGSSYIPTKQTQIVNIK